MFQLDQLLTPELSFCGVPGISRKRVFETAARLICEQRPELDNGEVYNNLLAREKLGSTGLGGGIAIPHCRLSGCEDAIGVLMTLEEPVEFDAPDGAPVDILFLLIVPVEAQQAHLDILAGLAKLLSQDAFCELLRAAGSNEQLFRDAVEFQS